MPDQNPAHNESAIDLHLGNAPAYLAKKLAVPGVMILTSNADGTIGMSAHGIETHTRANEMLSVGIFMNLQMHYDAIRNGANGPEAREHQEAIDRLGMGLSQEVMQ